jgi:hypothetical protein
LVRWSRSAAAVASEADRRFSGHRVVGLAMLPWAEATVRRSRSGALRGRGIGPWLTADEVDRAPHVPAVRTSYRSSAGLAVESARSPFPALTCHYLPLPASQAWHTASPEQACCTYAGSTPRHARAAEGLPRGVRLHNRLHPVARRRDTGLGGTELARLLVIFGCVVAAWRCATGRLAVLLAERKAGLL